MVVFHVMIFSLDLLSRSMQVLLLVERLTSYFDDYWLQLGKLFDGCHMYRRQKRQTFPRVVLSSVIQTIGSYSYWLKKVFCSQANRFIKNGIRNCQSSVCNKRKHFKSNQSRRWAVIKKRVVNRTQRYFIFLKYSCTGTHFKEQNFSIQGEQKRVENVRKFRAYIQQQGQTTLSCRYV